MDNIFVPYKESLELKQLGFNEPCFAFYYDKNFVTVLHRLDKEVINAPTFEQAFKFFRDNYNLFFWVYKYKNKYCYTDETGNILNRDFEIYEQARLECLKELIKIVKNG